jgi:alkylation response protein AidB-like acyl-CoA dehydrogenase
MPISNEKRGQFRKRAERIAREVVAPRAAEIDARREIPAEVKTAFLENGLLSLILPDFYGGTNCDIPALCMVVEETAKVCTSSSLLILSHAVGTLPIYLSGKRALKERIFNRISEGEIMAFALTEPDAGSDAAAIKSRAILNRTGYTITGRKCFISFGGTAAAYSAFVSTEPEKRLGGISCILVERNRPGVSIGKIEEKMGMHGSDTAELIFDEVVVPKENRVGEEGHGWYVAMSTLLRSRPAVGAQAVGLSQGARDYGVAFVKQSLRNGRPLSESQWVKFKIAELDTQIEAARSLVYRTASLINVRRKGVALERLSAMAKFFATDVAMMVTGEVVQLLEDQGYTRRAPVERMMRDAKILQIYEGTNQIQRMIIAHSIFK